MERASIASRRWLAIALVPVVLSVGAACAGGDPTPEVRAETTAVPTTSPAPRPSSAEPEPSTLPGVATTEPPRREPSQPGSSTTTTTAGTTPVTGTMLAADVAELPTLRVGDEGPEVRALQEMLNRVRLAGLVADGRFGPATTAAVEEFQAFVWLPVTGDADHATRVLLGALAANATVPTWPAPTVGNGSFPGCQVSVVGDSLMAGVTAMHVNALAEIGCAADVDAVGGRSLNYGWQCRVRDGDRTPLMLLAEPQPGNASCAPSGLELLELWASSGGLGDLVVVALGTNDAGLYRESTWVAHWAEAMRLAGGRPVLFLTSQARPGDRRVESQAAYSARLRTWCATTPRCFVGDWATTAVANDPASYADGVHLRIEATRARSRFLRDAVAAVLAGIDPATIASTVPPTTSSTSTTTTTLPPTTTTAPVTTTVTTTVTTITIATTTTTTPPSTTTVTTTITTTITTTVPPSTTSTVAATTTTVAGPG